MIFTPSLRSQLIIGAFILGARNSFDGKEEAMKIINVNDESTAEARLNPVCTSEI